jgi:hypothetical protein
MWLFSIMKIIGGLNTLAPVVFNFNQFQYIISKII